MKMSCVYCTKGYPLPLQSDYSGIEAGFITDNGLLRIRAFDENDDLQTQDIVSLNYCPICGRKLYNVKNKEN